MISVWKQSDRIVIRFFRNLFKINYRKFITQIRFNKYVIATAIRPLKLYSKMFHRFLILWFILFVSICFQLHPGRMWASMASLYNVGCFCLQDNWINRTYNKLSTLSIRTSVVVGNKKFGHIMYLVHFLKGIFFSF